jgi:hypothetical protein
MDSDDTCRRHCLNDVPCLDLHIVTTVHRGYCACLPRMLSDLAGAGDVAERQVMGGGCVLLATCAGVVDGCGGWFLLGAVVDWAGGGWWVVVEDRGLRVVYDAQIERRQMPTLNLGLTNRIPFRLLVRAQSIVLQRSLMHDSDGV